MRPLSYHRMVLLKAADLIERHGWVQGDYGGPEVGYCMVGAIYAVADPSSLCGWESLLLLGDYLDGQVSVWNDVPGRGKEEVISALRAAAVHGL